VKIFEEKAKCSQVYNSHWKMVVKRPETGEVALVFGRYVSEDDPRG